MLAVIAILVSFADSLPAQQVPKRIFVDTAGPGGEPVLDLTAAEFTITENGVRRTVTRATLGNLPMRIALMVDSSTATSPMMNNFRQALNLFVDTLAPEHEITFISSGGQIRVRTPPSANREKLRTEIARFASEGGANAFLETLIESDQRFLKPAQGQWPVFVIVTTDFGESRREPDIARYNRFMNDFLGRGGVAHAVVMSGKQIGFVTDLAQNLVQNTNGTYQSIVVDTALHEKLKGVANRVNEDHIIMQDRYEVEFTGDAKAIESTIVVGVTRDGVRLQMSPRRPF
jgi:hypothetical protein